MELKVLFKKKGFDRLNTALIDIDLFKQFNTRLRWNTIREETWIISLINSCSPCRPVRSRFRGEKHVIEREGA